MDELTRRELVEAGLLPEAMPNNVTFNKVRAILSKLENTDPEKLRVAIGAATGLKIRGPLASMIFIKHCLSGAHAVEIDRIAESEEGKRFAVLVYPEGEVPIEVELLPEGVNDGRQLRYDPSEEIYRW